MARRTQAKSLKREAGPRSRLFTYINDAASLRLELEPYYEDQSTSDRGGQIYYAVDTNVIKLFLEPNKVGPKTRPGEGYGVVFSDDDDETSTALAAALSRFIFWRLTKARPLVLLIGHDAEARGMFDAIAADVRANHGVLRSSRQQLKSMLSALRRLKTIDDQVKFLEANAPTLLEHLFFETDASAILNRFSMLMNSGRMTRLCIALNQPGYLLATHESSTALRLSFKRPDTLRDQIEESSYRVAWRERLLRASKRARLREAAVKADAAALARLELINNRLSVTEHRLVLITGDRKMFEAGHTYWPFGPNGKSFSDLYFRHPRAFLMVPDVLMPGEGVGPGPSNARSLPGGWLDTLLARYADGRGVLRSELRRVVRKDSRARSILWGAVNKALKTDPYAADTVKSQWLEHTKHLRDGHAAASQLAREEIKRFVGIALEGDIDEALDNIDKVLVSAREKTWRLFFSSVMRTGYDLLGGHDVYFGPPRRNAPPIDFSSWRHTRAFLHRILSADDLTRVGRAEFESLIGAVQKESRTGYALALAYALLFAKAGRWHVALLITERAIEIAEQVKSNVAEKQKNNKRITREEKSTSGREAYYFAAVCHRLQAKDLKDLDVAEWYYQKSQEAFSIDCIRNPKLEAGRARFLVERQLLWLGRYMFASFVQGERADGLPITDILRTIQDELPTLDTITDIWMAKFVERIMLSNLFLAAALTEHAGTLDKATEQFLRSAIERYRLNLADKKKILREDVPITFAAKCISTYAFARYRDLSDKERAEMQGEIPWLRQILKEEPDRMFLMRYDNARFKLLLDLADRILSKRVKTQARRERRLKSASLH